MQVIHVQSAEDMFNAVKERYAEQDIVFKAAAVSDYTLQMLQHKMKSKKENYLSHSNVQRIF